MPTTVRTAAAAGGYTPRATPAYLARDGTVLDEGASDPLTALAGANARKGGRPRARPPLPCAASADDDAGDALARDARARARTRSARSSACRMWRHGRRARALFRGCASGAQAASPSRAATRENTGPTTSRSARRSSTRSARNRRDLALYERGLALLDAQLAEMSKPPRGAARAPAREAGAPGGGGDDAAARARRHAAHAPPRGLRRQYKDRVRARRDAPRSRRRPPAAAAARRGRSSSRLRARLGPPRRRRACARRGVRWRGTRPSTTRAALPPPPCLHTEARSALGMVNNRGGGRAPPRARATRGVVAAARVSSARCLARGRRLSPLSR